MTRLPDAPATDNQSPYYPMREGQTHSPIIYRIEVSLSIEGHIETTCEVRYVHERDSEGLRLPLGTPGPFFTLPIKELDPIVGPQLLRLPPPWSESIASSTQARPRRLESQAFPDRLLSAICYASPGQVKRYTKALRLLVADWCKEQSRFMRQASRTARGGWWPW